MAALNFPTTGLVAGVTQYTSDLGTTYIWDGVKWVGHSAGGSVGTNSIANNGHTVQVDAGGNLVLPEYSLPNTVGTTGQVLKWPASGSTLAWANDNNNSGTVLPANASGYLINDGSGGLSWGAGDGTGVALTAATDSTLGGIKLGEGFVLNGSDQVTTSKLYSTNQSQPNQHYRLELTNTGTIKLPDQSEIIGSTGYLINDGSGGLSWGITIGPTAQNSEESWVWVDKDGAHIATNYSGDLDPQHQWDFDNSGTLSLAGDLIVADNGGHIYIDNDLSSATSIRWVNTYGDSELFRVYADSREETSKELFQAGFNQDTDPGFYISTTTNADGLGNDPADDHTWNFTTDGNLVLPQTNMQTSPAPVSWPGITFSDGTFQNTAAGETLPRNITLSLGSTISDQATSVDVVVGRVSDNAYWYNLFGDTGATINANATVNGSVCHDSGGNVYSLGSVTHSNSFNTDNLFLKYSPEGNLLWRRTWTDNAGLDCGSLNASLRFIAANVELGTQDTILWAGWVPTQNISYVGTMDTEGNMVDQFGDTRLATRLDNVRVTDLEWVGNIYGDGNSTVGVAGNYYLFDGNDQYRPYVGAVDLDTAVVIYDQTLVPAGSDSTTGGWYNRSWDNTFKAITVFPGNLTGSAFAGTYYDGADSHAMIGASGEGTTLFQIGQGTDDNIGEDICCDANGNVYVIVNNTTSNYAVLSKVNIDALFATQDSVWQIQLGFDPITGGDSFYATAVAYDNGYVYVLGTYYNVEDDNTDTMLIKVGIGNGDVVWQRRIGTAVNEGPGGAGVFGSPGWESSSGISIYDNLIAVTFSTADNSVDELNTVTLQYPTDGSVLGTFGDFTITDFDIGSIPADYGITTLTASTGSAMATGHLATLNPTVQTVGTGWTNTQWDLANNREVFGTQTFKFNSDGTFDTAEIRHQSNVRITANTTVANTTPSTWTFQNNDGLRFPDGSVQYGAYVETETALDGGSAVTVFNIVPRPTIVDGGGSGSRHGVADPAYDGNDGNNYVLDGGGA